MPDIASVLDEQRHDLLAKLQQPPPELGPVHKRPDDGVICRPDCSVCGGVGWYRLDVPPTDARFGKLQRCPNINRAELPGADRYGLTAKERRLSWNRILPLGNPAVGRAAQAVRETMARGYGWVYLWGGYGQAKTLILKIAVAEWLKRDDGVYTTMADVLEHLRAAYDTDSPSREHLDRLAWWSGLPLLAIDEIDRVRGTEFAQEKRFTLMDRRYQQAIRQDRSVTLMAANEPPSRLPGELADRLLDGRFVVVHLDGPSARPAMDWTVDY